LDFPRVSHVSYDARVTLEFLYRAARLPTFLPLAGKGGREAAVRGCAASLQCYLTLAPSLSRKREWARVERVIDA